MTYQDICQADGHEDIRSRGERRPDNAGVVNLPLDQSLSAAEKCRRTSSFRRKVLTIITVTPVQYAPAGRVLDATITGLF